MYYVVLYSKQVSSWLSKKATNLETRLGTAAASALCTELGAAAPVGVDLVLSECFDAIAAGENSVHVS